MQVKRSSLSCSAEEWRTRPLAFQNEAEPRAQLGRAVALLVLWGRQARARQGAQKGQKPWAPILT